MLFILLFRTIYRETKPNGTTGERFAVVEYGTIGPQGSGGEGSYRLG